MPAGRFSMTAETNVPALIRVQRVRKMHGAGLVYSL
jgi:hypothetical protein